MTSAQHREATTLLETIRAGNIDARHRIDILALHEALNQLAALHERQSRVVEPRFFGGYAVAEIADLLQVSVATVEGDFRKASAFLRGRLVEDPRR